jgi:hypothetical protein
LQLGQQQRVDFRPTFREVNQAALEKQRQHHYQYPPSIHVHALSPHCALAPKQPPNEAYFWNLFGHDNCGPGQDLLLVLDAHFANDLTTMGRR